MTGSRPRIAPPPATAAVRPGRSWEYPARPAPYEDS